VTTEGPVSIYEASRLALARTRLAVPEELTSAVEHACMVSARALDIERVGVWLLDRDASALHCVAQYDRGNGTVSRGEIVHLGAAPAYLAAIESRKTVAASDARLDPRTAELATTYLEPHRISSMLDAPIFKGGAVYGIVCHEHVGAPRAFVERDVDFASSVADILTALFEQAGRLAAEEELRRSDRLRALGRLSASVAHDFNNVLGVLALTSGGNPEAQSAIEIGRRLVGKLMVFGQHVPSAPDVLDLAEVLRGMAPFFDALESEVKIELRLPDDGAAVRARIGRSEIEQVVLNLVFNARDASPPRSVVWITLEADPTEVRLQVRDRGTGMSADVRNRIFEPFFTTKEPGRGSGMGLATVYGIVTSVGGRVGVESEPGVGSVFTVRFPRAE
jgi:signal transduction histidine kinase